MSTGTLSVVQTIDNTCDPQRDPQQFITTVQQQVLEMTGQSSYSGKGNSKNVE